MKNEDTARNNIKTVCNEISKVFDLVDWDTPDEGKTKETKKQVEETEKMLKKIQSQLEELS